MVLIGRVVVGAFLTIAVWAPAAAGHGHLRVATPDGSRFLFASSEALVPSDNDSARDLYLRSDGRNKLVTPDTRQDVHPADYALSVDGSRVVFTTKEPLVQADTDAAWDVYERSGGGYRLLSTGPGSEAYLSLAEVSDDASRVVFDTSARLVPTDTDSAFDIYVHANGTTTLLSTSASAAGGEHNHATLDASSDGTHVFDLTDEALVPFDRDGGPDIYEHYAGTTRLVSTGTLDTGLRGDFVDSLGSSEDGSSFLFITTVPLEPGDSNDTEDLYQRKDGRTRLLSANGAGVTMPCSAQSDEPIGPCQYYEASQASDGGSVAFRAGQSLTPDDTNSTFDVYLRTGPTIAHAGPGSSPYIRHDGAKVVFYSAAQLAAGDTDSFTDVYEYADGQNRLLTAGPDGGDVLLSQPSRDFSHAFFGSWGAFVPEDTDGRWDYYEVFGGRIRLITTGPSDDHGPGGDIPTDFRTTDDGSRAYFRSDKPLVPEDTDTADDLYEWRDGVTTLVTQ